MPRPQQIVGAILLMGLAAALLSRLYPLQDQGQGEAALERERQALQTRLLLPRPYLFIHIPKSGGTAIGKLAEQAENGGPGFIRYWHHPREQRVIAEMLQHDFVFGHFKYGVHAHFEPRPCTYMTIMRDPIDRVVSHYYYHRASVTDRFHHLARDNTLDRWVELSLDGQNDQVQFISGIYGKVNESVYAVAEHNLRSVRVRFFFLLVRGLAKKARRSQFGFVGLYELMDESVVMMQYFAGFQNLLFNKTKAVTDRPHTSGRAEDGRN